jgi:hypothetical protein
MLRTGIAVALLALVTAAPALADESDRANCLRIERVTAFAPRDEVYVEIGADCDERGFEDDDTVQAYLEVLISDLPAVGRDLRVYRDESPRRMTFEFRDLGFEVGDSILVRLVRFGEIIDLLSIKAP